MWLSEVFQLPQFLRDRELLILLDKHTIMHGIGALGRIVDG